MDCERLPALDQNSLPVDHLAGVNGAGRWLGAYLDCDAPSDAALGGDPASWAMSCAISEWSSWIAVKSRGLILT
jgi:hypothetical protein